MVAIGCYCLFVETPPQVVAQLLPSRLLLPQHCHTSGAYYCHNLQISTNKCSPEKSSATVGLSGEGTKVVNDPMKPHQLIWQFCIKCVTLKIGKCDNKNIARIANAVQCHNFNCQVTKIVMNSGSQLSVLLLVSQMSQHRKDFFGQVRSPHHSEQMS